MWFRTLHDTRRARAVRSRFGPIVIPILAGALGIAATGGCDAPAIVARSAPTNPDSSPPAADNGNDNNLVDSNIDTNGPPPRAIRATPTSGDGSLTWSFNVVGAPASERGTHTFRWEFGDGGFAEGALATHAYAGVGSYSVSLTATDPEGLLAYQLSTSVTVSQGQEGPAGILVVTIDAHLEHADSVFTLRATARTSALSAGETVDFEWSFADGESATGAEITHVLEGVSPYRVEVAARTSAGRTASRFEHFTLADDATTDESTNGDPVDTNGAPADPTPPEDVNTSGPPPAGALKAFPTAEGFGALARGGRGGQVIYVTTLADYASNLPNGQQNPSPIVGSLRWACERNTGPRTILFRVGGTIALTGPLLLVGEQGSYVTIAGHSAPGDGIQLTGYAFEIGGGAHDVVVRHLRMRTGYAGPGEVSTRDAITIAGVGGTRTHSIIIDHCSLEWALDENSDTWGRVENLTMQWCIFGEGGTFGQTPACGCGYLIGGPEGTPSDQFLSIHHSLFVNNWQRNPKMAPNGGLVEFVNNYVSSYTYMGTEILPIYSYSPRANLVGNVYAFGPPEAAIVVQDYNGRQLADGSLYVADILSPATPNANSDPWLAIYYSGGVWPDYLLGRSKQRLTPWPVYSAHQIAADPAQSVVGMVLVGAGANYPAYDAVDQRLVMEAADGTGTPGFGDETNPDPWPVLNGGTPYTDSDNDGMSDSWEFARGLDPGNSADGPLDDDGDGYTNLEEFLNSIVGE